MLSLSAWWSYARRSELRFLSLLFLCFSCNTQQGTKKDDPAYAKVLDTAEQYFVANKLLQGTKYLEKQTPKFKDISIAQRFKYYDYHIVYHYFGKNDKVASLRYTDSMLSMFKTTQDKKLNLKLLGQAHFTRGDLLFDLGRYNDAYIQYDEAKQAVSSVVDKCSLSEYSYRMGMVMYKQEQFRLAVKFFKKSYAESENCELDFRIFYRRQEVLDNIGLAYRKLNQPDSALHYYDQALAYVDAHGAKFPEKKDFMAMAHGVVYGNMAEIHVLKGDFNKAKALFKKGIQINLKSGRERRDAQLSEVRLARLFLQKGEIDSIRPVLNNLRAQLDTVPNITAEADWNFLMANYFQRKGDPQKAVNYFLTYDRLKDSVQDGDRALKETNITEQLKRFEKEYEVETLKKDKSIQNIYLKIAILFTGMSLVILVLIWQNFRRSKRNINTLATLNKQINQQNKELEAAMTGLKSSSQEKDRILRTVAHDLRNPLGGIASLTSVMAEESEYTEEQKELLKIIKETSFDSLELINEILEATNTSNSDFNKQWVDINSVLNNSVELLRFKAAEKNQHIELETLNTVQELLINREKIWRVISNLISNAIKFSPVGAQITVKAVNTEDAVQISVTDHGIGIPDILKSKVFNMFTEAKRPGTLGEKSFGLGLSICRQIIEKHNGQIWFESDPVNGTTFYVTLLKDTKPQPAPLLQG